MTIREWVPAAIVASYPPLERQAVWQGVLRYLDWLEALPVTRREARVRL